MEKPHRYTIRRFKGGFVLVYSIEGEQARVPCFTIQQVFSRISEIEDLKTEDVVVAKEEAGKK